MKLINQTLKNQNGEWSQKRIMTFTSFWIATIYAFMPLFIKDFEVKEFVFIGFLATGGWSVYRTQKTNENLENYTNDNNEC
jgi:hypothetical protein